jgi:hypothetical protein
MPWSNINDVGEQVNYVNPITLPLFHDTSSDREANGNKACDLITGVISRFQGARSAVLTNRVEPARGARRVRHRTAPKPHAAAPDTVCISGWRAFQHDDSYRAMNMIEKRYNMENLPVWSTYISEFMVCI